MKLFFLFIVSNVLLFSNSNVGDSNSSMDKCKQSFILANEYVEKGNSYVQKNRKDIGIAKLEDAKSSFDKIVLDCNGTEYSKTALEKKKEVESVLNKLKESESVEDRAEEKESFNGKLIMDAGFSDDEEYSE